MAESTPTTRREFKLGDKVVMRRGVKAGAVGTVINIFRHTSGRRGLRARCDYAEQFEMHGFFIEFDMVEAAPATIAEQESANG